MHVLLCEILLKTSLEQIIPILRVSTTRNCCHSFTMVANIICTAKCCLWQWIHSRSNPGCPTTFPIGILMGHEWMSQRKHVPGWDCSYYTSAGRWYQRGKTLLQQSPAKLKIDRRPSCKVNYNYDDFYLIIVIEIKRWKEIILALIITLFFSALGLYF